MKKSLRVLSLVLAVVMIMGSVSILGSAWDANGYTAYRSQNGSGLSFDDANDPIYSTDQYASMALDELDRMLAKEQIVLDIYIGTVDLSSVDGTIDSVNSLLGSVGNLLSLGLLGDAQYLDASAIAETKRKNGDITVLWDLLDLIGDLYPIVYNYVSGNFSLGILNGFVADYVFNVRELVFGLLCGVTGLGGEGYDYMEQRTIPAKYQGSGTATLFLQDVLDSLVLGEWTKLDDKFYEVDKHSNIAYSELMFHNGSATGAYIDSATTPLDTAHYDYYGWVHEDRWVTSALGDYIRVAEGAAAPAPSYTKVDFTKNTAVYEFVEPLLLYAFNNLAVPVLNRLVKKWLREKSGYTYEEKYTELYTADLPEYKDLKWEDKIKDTNLYTAVVNEDGETEYEAVINPNYDYLYAGTAPEELSGDAIFSIFDVENLQVPRVSVISGHTFVQDLNRNATLILKAILKADYTKTGAANSNADGDVYTFTWTGTGDRATETYHFDWTYGDNSNVAQNVCNFLKFLLQVTGDEFFSGILVNKGAVKTAAEVELMSNQQVVSYVLRSVLNANIPYMWIEESEETQTIAGVGFEAVVQLAYQDIPQFTYTRPANATNEQLVNKALAILMDIAAYNINAVLDTNLNKTATNANYDPNTNTGLLAYLGDSGNYSTSVAIIAAWAVSTWANSSYGNLLNYDFALDNYNGTTGNGAITEDTFWSDLDNVLNAIIPIKTVAGASTSAPDNRPWIAAEIANASGSVSKTFVFDYVLYPILNLDFTNIFKILEKNDNGAFTQSTIENVIVDTVHRIFDLLIPDAFKNGINTIDSFLVNSDLASMVRDLIVTLSATRTTGATGSGFTQVKTPFTTTNGGVIKGRGKIIAEVALPIVCMIIGLSDTQEFGELENYIPATISSTDATTKFLIYNGSSGVNASYRDPNDATTYKKKVDKLYTYEITAAACKVIGGSNLTVIGGNGETLAAGASTQCSISGYTSGDMLEIVFRYKVKDENGSYLNGGQELSSTTYTYVGDTDKGDDEILKTKTINGQTIQYPENIYITGGLSGIESYAFRIKDAKGDGTTTAVQVTNVTVAGQNNVKPQKVNASGTASNYTTVATNWVSRTTDEAIYKQNLSGQSGTYVFTPFAVDENASRIAWEYQKDSDGNEVKNDYGQKVKTKKVATEGDAYYIPEGQYKITTTINVGGTTGTIDTYVHVYNDYGLNGLVNSAINANRSTASITDAGQGQWSSYYSALTNAAKFALAPKNQGANFETHISQSGSYENKYEYYYDLLYAQIENIKKYEKNSGAQAIWDAVNSVWPYNYTRVSETYGGTTIYFREWKDYDDPTYSYMGMRNYVGDSYRTFKSAVSDANSLIDREFKYAYCTKDEFDAMTTEQKNEVLKAYKADVEDNTSAISSVDSAYAIHRVNLTYNRLIALSAGNNSKLQKIYTAFGNINANTGFSVSSYAEYTRAKAFAAAVIADTNAPTEKSTTALTWLLSAWKGLEEGANYTALTNIVSAEKNYIAENIMWGLEGFSADGAIVVDDAANQQVYTTASYKAYLEAIAAGDVLLNDLAAGNDLGKGDQYKIDDAVLAITTAKANLVDYTEGGDEPGPGGDDEPSYAIVKYEVGEEPYLMGSGGINMKYYAPVINEEDALTAGLTAIDDELTTNDNAEYDETPIDGVLYGVPEWFTEEDIAAIFTCENCSVTVTATEGGLGTGSFAIILDNSNHVLACYAIVLRGDLNGDGTVDASDMEALDCFNAGFDEFNWYEFDQYYLLAGDVNGDYGTDAMDYSTIDYYLGGLSDFDQAYGGEYFEEDFPKSSEE